MFNDIIITSLLDVGPKFGSYEADWVKDQVQEVLYDDGEKKFECTDNFRLALVGDADSEKEYAKRQEQGCCGFYDTTLTAPSGNVYKFGFNYGH